MKPKKPLQPKDFPVQTDGGKITKNDGEPIADARNDKLAEDIADRLNADNDPGPPAKSLQRAYPR